MDTLRETNRASTNPVEQRRAEAVPTNPVEQRRAEAAPSNPVEQSRAEAASTNPAEQLPAEAAQSVSRAEHVGHGHEDGRVQGPALYADPVFRATLSVMLMNLAVLGLLAWWLRDPRAEAVQVHMPPTPTSAPPTSTPTPGTLTVYVSGAVRTPGLVSLPEGARAGDAVEAAGGLTDAAEVAGVNLAAPLADGQQLHLPDASVAATPAPGISNPGGATRGGSGAGNAGATNTGGHGSPSRVNVNTASQAELETLPGVGPALAGRILAHRDQYGRFGSPDDLLAVAGIGDKTLARLRDLVTVE